MEGGQDFAAPPVRVWRAAAHAALLSMLSGAERVSMGAGGFARVTYLPELVRVHSDSNPNTTTNLTAAARVSREPLFFKRPISP